MGLPRKLKNFIMFHNGLSFVGEVAEVTLPKLSRKMEDYIAGGMTGPVPVDFGNEAITFEWMAGGFQMEAIKQYGAKSHGAVQLRFAGAYQEDDEGSVSAIEIVVRGRYKEIDMGNGKIADDTAHKYSMPCSYYKLSVNDKDLIELDFMNCVEKINGVSVNDEIRKAIGL